MAYKTVALALVTEGDGAADSAIGLAIDLAQRHGAHLAVGIGVPPLIIPVDGASVGMMATYEEENVTLRKQSEALAERIRNDSMRAGVNLGVVISSQPYRSFSADLLRLARLSDVCVVEAPDAASVYKSDCMLDILVASGAPVLIAPANWSQRGAATKAIVAWDESASAARAVRGALALLVEAQSVEVVCVTGDKVMPSVTPGADLAQYLARHCRDVTETEIPTENADAAATLRQHALLTHADLLVLGGYGHSRFHEFVLGGFTRSTLQNIAIPTLMAH